MKSDAYDFLASLHLRLEQRIGSPECVRQRIGELETLAAQDKRYKHYCGTEHTFTKGIALPAIYEELTTTFQNSPEQARASIYAEGFTNFRDMATNTPARKTRHPFSKVFITDPREIYAQWAGRASGAALKQSCPDFALRDPFPHNILFEAKYFQGRTAEAGERELVSTVYQAFFYRGLPENLSHPSRPWGYDYAVAFVYDASPEGHFEAAWRALPKAVKAGFWDGANVYIMVLRGEEGTKTVI